MLTVPEAARRVDRNPETVRRWIRERKLIAWKVGHQHVIDEDDLTNFMASGGARGGPAVSTPDAYETIATIHQNRAERSSQIAEAVGTYAPAVQVPTDEWLPAIVGRIVRLVDPVRIVLFGSRAAGHARPESDYDLLVVVDEAPDRRQTRIAIRRSLSDLPVSEDIVVATGEEVGRAPSMIGDVLRSAVLTGRTVYERPESG